MPKTLDQTFSVKSKELTHDLEKKNILKANIAHYTHAFNQSKQQFAHLEMCKSKAHYLKWKVTDQLDRYLIEFERKFTENGGKVIWANNKEEALSEIKNLIRLKNAKSIVHSKSALIEELGLKALLKELKIEAVATDFGDFIASLDHRQSDHAVNSIASLHLKKIKAILHEKLNIDCEELNEKQLLQKINALQRPVYEESSIGISGANFLIAETGSVSVTENEGNIRLISTLPKTHIVIAGIDKIIPTLKDSALFWPLLSTHATGQHAATYNSVLSGPRQPYESDGPEEMYVILLDNGRTDLLAKPAQRESLYCIRCGACAYESSVYQCTGEKVDSSAYQGPIGAIVSPQIYGDERYYTLSKASTLRNDFNHCCPVKIDLQTLLLHKRHEAIQHGQFSSSEKRNWQWYAKLALNRKKLDFLGGKWKNIIYRLFLKKAWGNSRELPQIANKSFAKQWKEYQKNKNNN